MSRSIEQTEGEGFNRVTYSARCRDHSNQMVAGAIIEWQTGQPNIVINLCKKIMWLETPDNTTIDPNRDDELALYIDQMHLLKPIYCEQPMQITSATALGQRAQDYIKELFEAYDQAYLEWLERNNS